MSDFNPGDGSVDDAKQHVADHPEEAAAVLQAEKNGDNRSTLVKHLEKLVEAQSAAPVAAESMPVTVAPASAPGLLDNFEVSPERGYRRKS